MTPIAWHTLGLKGRSEGCSHVVHSLAHHNQLIEPLSEVGWVVQDGSSNPCSMLGRRRVVCSNNDLDLGKYPGGSLFISTDKVQASSTFTIKSHSLSEGLSAHELDSLIDEKSKPIGILVKAATGEALVCRVEEWVELASLANISNSLPLLWGWVDTSWVVGTHVQQHNRSWLS